MDWKKFFDSLGMNGTKWQWRIMRWQKSWSDRGTTMRQQGKQVAYRHKFCDECGALLDRNDKECHRCGARASTWRGQAFRRAIGMVIPSSVPVSMTITSVNIIMFIVIVAMGGPQALFSPPREVMLRLGVLVPVLVHGGDYWTIITCGYLHFGIIHIGFNMLVLSQVGPMLEDEIGASRFFTLYTLSLIGGAMLGLLVRGPVVVFVAGASGALFGLIGFGVSYAHFRGGNAHAQRDFFLRWAFFAFIIGILVPGIDNLGHLGGFLTGAALGYVIERERIHMPWLSRVWPKTMYVCIALTLAAFIWMIKANITGYYDGVGG